MLLKNITSLLILIAAVSSAWASDGTAPSYTVVSDLDDTIKQTDVKHPADVLNRTFRKDAFSGMAQLYRQLILFPMESGNEPRDLAVISASPKPLQKTIEAFMRENRFPTNHRVYTRNWITQPKISAYKLSVLERLTKRSTKPIVLLGDDTEGDSATYAEFQRRHPERVLAVYIHTVVGKRRLADGQIAFRTAFDVARKEVEAGRLDLPGALEVGMAILTDSDAHLMPWFKVCPAPRQVVADPSDLPRGSSRLSAEALMQAMPPSLEDAYVWMGEQIDGRIEEICLKRAAH